MSEDVQPKVSKFKAWVEATRPRVFTASFVPIGIAAVIAAEDGVLSWWKLIASLLGVIFLQTTANLVNEYMDYMRGSDDLKQAGQSLALKQKLLSPTEVLIGAIVSTILGCAIGLFLVAQSGYWLLAIGFGGVLIAITYTAGPFPLAYHGLGEVAAGVFMGPMIVVGAYYVMDPLMMGERLIQIILISFPIMFTTAAILHANNIRDLEADRAANKRTLAVIFGREIARKEFRLLLALCYLSQAILVVMQWIPPLTLLSLITIVRAYTIIRTFDAEDDSLVLHVAQTQTAQLHGQYGLLFVVGWALQIVFF